MPVPLEASDLSYLISSFSMTAPPVEANVFGGCAAGGFVRCLERLALTRFRVMEPELVSISASL
jgi:hypothetical protein